MFKMNPNAKEFIPAHLKRKKKEEEEANGVSDLANQMGKIDLKTENGTGDESKSNNDQKVLANDGVEEKPVTSTTTSQQSDSSTKPSSDATQTSSHHNSRPNHYKNKYHNNRQSNNDEARNSGDRNHSRQNHQPHQMPEEDYSQYYPEDDYDEHCYLASGENICEFNGEQFIIPNDDEIDEYINPPENVAYDFGNDEDNEDDEVQKAFEQFLGGLPQ